MARKDLIPQSMRSPEERKKIARAGGIAAGEARRRKKQTRELILELLAVAPKLTAKQARQLQKAGLDADGVTIEALSLIAIANHAMAGDLAAAKFLYDYAQIPDLRAQLERERLKAAAKAGETAEAASLRQAREILGGVDSVIE